jgi:hypothetical protein
MMRSLRARSCSVRLWRPIACAAIALCAPAIADDREELKIRFDDPFFRITHDIEPCPQPRGPYATEAEALAESHHRAERGTRCYQEGRCRLPSSYDYDRGIAARIERDFAEKRLALPRSTLWVLVKGRRVFIQGCVPSNYRAGELRKKLMRIPDVELAIEDVRIGAGGKVPYRVR